MSILDINEIPKYDGGTIVALAPKEFKVIVAGGRKFTSYEDLCRYLDIMLERKISQGFEIHHSS